MLGSTALFSSVTPWSARKSPTPTHLHGVHEDKIMRKSPAPTHLQKTLGSLRIGTGARNEARCARINSLATHLVAGLGSTSAQAARRDVLKDRRLGVALEAELDLQVK